MADVLPSATGPLSESSARGGQFPYGHRSQHLVHGNSGSVENSLHHTPIENYYNNHNLNHHHHSTSSDLGRSNSGVRNYSSGNLGNSSIINNNNLGSSASVSSSIDSGSNSRSNRSISSESERSSLRTSGGSEGRVVLTMPPERDSVSSQTTAALPGLDDSHPFHYPPSHPHPSTSSSSIPYSSFFVSRHLPLSSSSLPRSFHPRFPSSSSSFASHSSSLPSSTPSSYRPPFLPHSSSSSSSSSPFPHRLPRSPHHPPSPHPPLPPPPPPPPPPPYLYPPHLQYDDQPGVSPPTTSRPSEGAAAYPPPPPPEDAGRRLEVRASPFTPTAPLSAADLPGRSSGRYVGNDGFSRSGSEEGSRIQSSSELGDFAEDHQQQQRKTQTRVTDIDREDKEKEEEEEEREEKEYTERERENAASSSEGYYNNNNNYPGRRQPRDLEESYRQYYYHHHYERQKLQREQQQQQLEYRRWGHPYQQYRTGGSPLPVGLLEEGASSSASVSARPTSWCLDRRHATMVLDTDLEGNDPHHHHPHLQGGDAPRAQGGGGGEDPASPGTAANAPGPSHPSSPPPQPPPYPSSASPPQHPPPSHPSSSPPPPPPPPPPASAHSSSEMSPPASAFSADSPVKPTSPDDPMMSPESLRRLHSSPSKQTPEADGGLDLSARAHTTPVKAPVGMDLSVPGQFSPEFGSPSARDRRSSMPRSPDGDDTGFTASGFGDSGVREKPSSMSPEGKQHHHGAASSTQGLQGFSELARALSDRGNPQWGSPTSYGKERAYHGADPRAQNDPTHSSSSSGAPSATAGPSSPSQRISHGVAFPKPFSSYFYGHCGMMSAPPFSSPSKAPSTSSSRPRASSFSCSPSRPVLPPFPLGAAVPSTSTSTTSSSGWLKMDEGGEEDHHHHQHQHQQRQRLRDRPPHHQGFVKEEPADDYGCSGGGFPTSSTSSPTSPPSSTSTLSYLNQPFSMPPYPHHRPPPPTAEQMEAWSAAMQSMLASSGAMGPPGVPGMPMMPPHPMGPPSSAAVAAAAASVAAAAVAGGSGGDGGGGGGETSQGMGAGQVFGCHKCEFVAKSKEEFEDHMSVHYQFSCSQCDYKSRTDGRLQKHIRDFHGNPEGHRTTPSRPKVFRCKTCGHTCTDRLDSWRHRGVHIKPEKQLKCEVPGCPFVTEYKHHLEYHRKNHKGIKGFKCPKCNYSCNNKSMLNSHMKSHTKACQFRCLDCPFAAKYSHSLKIHLKKHGHRQGPVLNSDGSLPQYGLGIFGRGSGGGGGGRRGGHLGASNGPLRGMRRQPSATATAPFMPGFMPMMPPPGGCLPPPGMNPMMPPGAVFPFNHYWSVMGHPSAGASGSAVAPSRPPPLIDARTLGHDPQSSADPMDTQDFKDAKDFRPPFTLQASRAESPEPEDVKCELCPFTCPTMEQLRRHMRKVHGPEGGAPGHPEASASERALAARDAFPQRRQSGSGDRDDRSMPLSPYSQFPRDAAAMSDPRHMTDEERLFIQQLYSQSQRPYTEPRRHEMGHDRDGGGGAGGTGQPSFPQRWQSEGPADPSDELNILQQMTQRFGLGPSTSTGTGTSPPRFVNHPPAPRADTAFSLESYGPARDHPDRAQQDSFRPEHESIHSAREAPNNLNVVSQDEPGADLKRKAEDRGQDEKGESPRQPVLQTRKRSRKGKAFKLDQLLHMKTQEQEHRKSLERERKANLQRQEADEQRKEENESASTSSDGPEKAAATGGSQGLSEHAVVEHFRQLSENIHLLNSGSSQPDPPPRQEGSPRDAQPPASLRDEARSEGARGHEPEDHAQDLSGKRRGKDNEHVSRTQQQAMSQSRLFALSTCSGAEDWQLSPEARAQVSPANSSPDLPSQPPSRHSSFSEGQSSAVPGRSPDKSRRMSQQWSPSAAYTQYPGRWDAGWLALMEMMGNMDYSRHKPPGMTELTMPVPRFHSQPQPSPGERGVAYPQYPKHHPQNLSPVASTSTATHARSGPPTKQTSPPLQRSMPVRERPDYECLYCELSFRDRTQHSMHMSYHGKDNPFQCASCGNVSRDKLEFYRHLVTSKHP